MLLLQVFHPGRNIERPDGRERQSAIFAPGEKPAAGARIGAARVIIVDVGGEEFDVAPAGMGDEGRHYIGVGRGGEDGWFDDRRELVGGCHRPLLYLAAVRMLFDWLITGQIVPMNPAAAVRGPKHVVKTGKTPVLEDEEWRKLLASIPTTTLRDLRDRALIATLTYSFARIGAALKMKVEDLRPRGAGWTVRLREKGGKEHAMPCHHALAEALRAYIDAAGIAEDRTGFLFRTSPRHNAKALTDRPLTQANAWLMIRRRAIAAGITAPIGCHTFRATGVTAHLANGGALEHAQEMAAHESPRTTKLYDPTKERLTQDEVERIRLLLSQRSRS